MATRGFREPSSDAAVQLALRNLIRAARERGPVGLETASNPYTQAQWRMACADIGSAAATFVLRERQAAARSEGCTPECNHVAPSCRWPHWTMEMEDRGEIHTDDCGFWDCDHDHDPGDCCTSGQPGVLCRVGTMERQRELKKFQRLVARNRAAKRGK